MKISISFSPDSFGIIMPVMFVLIYGYIRSALNLSNFFFSEGLDSFLLPLRLPHSTEKSEELDYLNMQMLNDYYKDAVKYLQLALCSTPPVLMTLLPLIQVNVYFITKSQRTVILICYLCRKVL